MALLAPPPNTKPISFSPLRCPQLFKPGPTFTRSNSSPGLTILHNCPGFLGTKRSSIIRENKRVLRSFIVRAAASISVTGSGGGGGEGSGVGKIMLSDVVVKRRRNVYWGRKWSSVDVATFTVVGAMHLLCPFAPFVFNWAAFWVSVGLYFVTGLLGITLSYHRNLSHRSFKLPKWLEYLFAYCGAQAVQGHPIDWVSTHRYHHQFCDSEKDPHSPFEGFWYSHISWFFDSKTIVQKCGSPNNVGDLEKQPFYKFLERTYALHPVALGLLLYALGGFPFIVWGMGVRIVWVYHITWLVNSACHVWGKQAWNTGDLSRNNWWVAVLAFGEGWHNNHHAFEYSARHGLEWWQLDMTWYVVKFLQAIGLATDVKLPTSNQKQKLAFACATPTNSD